jgi:hypothetical protein
MDISVFLPVFFFEGQRHSRQTAVAFGLSLKQGQSLLTTKEATSKPYCKAQATHQIGSTAAFLQRMINFHQSYVKFQTP